MAGLAGFAESGGFEFALGSVTGARWWSITPDLMTASLAMLQPAQPPLTDWIGSSSSGNWIPSIPAPPVVRVHQDDALLSGAYGRWKPGENEAACRAGPERGAHEVPHRPCGCGFWAYWDLDQAPAGFNWDVAGVVEGYGRAVIGPLGFRCQKARIVAFHLKTRIRAVDKWNRPLDAPGDQEGAHRWHAEMEDLLERHYGARAWASLDAMAAYYPPNPDYASPDVMARAQARMARIRDDNRRAAETSSWRGLIPAQLDLNESVADATRRFTELMELLKRDEHGNDTKGTSTQ